MVAAQSEPVAARPILKWAGGKARLVSMILERLPERIETYREPFVGGGAVFFALAARKRFRRAVLCDLNADLVGVYRGVKRNVSGVVELLREYDRRHSKQTYYETRDIDPATLDLIERAARIIYLNKTGYNGLYRVNQSGRFNVPFGRYKNPAICDEQRLRAAARALRGVKLDVADFEEACEEATAGDAVYFDPPYVPRSRTANFTAYHSEAFGEREHERLARVFRRISRRKVAAVLSNSDTPATRELYEERSFHVGTVMVARPINSKSGARGGVPELLVTNRSARRPEVF